MTITINYSPKETAGYAPRKALTLHNVEKVVDKGVRMVEVHMTFSDVRPTHDHVASVVVIPDRE